MRWVKVNSEGGELMALIDSRLADRAVGDKTIALR